MRAIEAAGAALPLELVSSGGAGLTYAARAWPPHISCEFAAEQDRGHLPGLALGDHHLHPHHLYIESIQIGTVFTDHENKYLCRVFRFPPVCFLLTYFLLCYQCKSTLIIITMESDFYCILTQTLLFLCPRL